MELKYFINSETGHLNIEREQELVKVSLKSNGQETVLEFSLETLATLRDLFSEWLTIPSERMWRTLIIANSGLYFIILVIPSYSPDTQIYVPRAEIPEHILKLIDAGQTFFHARVNLGTDKNIRIEDWENE